MRAPTQDNPAVADELLDAVPTAGPAGAPSRSHNRLLLVPRVLGALALLATGAVHLQQFTRFYSQVATIGTLFILNFAGATAIGLALLASVQRVGGRRGGAILALLASAGIALAAVAFVFLLISERTPLFGFQEPGYDPPAIAASRAAEIATVVFLGTFLVGTFLTGRRNR